MKNFKFILLFIFALISMLAISCGNEPGNNHDSDIIIIPPKNVTVSFDTAGGDEIESVIQTVGKFYELPFPERKGYTFDGWYYNEAPVTITGEWYIEQNVKLSAKWKPIKYSIKYISIGGENINQATYTIEDELILKPLEWQEENADTVYIFEGWFKDLEYKEPIDSIKKGTTGNIVVYAKWKAVNIPEEKTETVITFKADGFECDGTTVTLTVGEDYSLPTIQRNGYLFAGWQSEDGSIVIQNSGIWVNQSEMITLVPNWTKNIYFITYILNGGANSDKNIEAYSVTDEIMLYEPTKHNHRFEGWYTDANFANKIDKISQGTFANITLYAKWYKTTFEITYDFNGGAAGSGAYPDKYDINTSDFQIGIPLKDGYKFIGWEYDGSIDYYCIISKGTDKDLNLKAMWYKHEFTYQDNNGIQYFLKDDNTLSVVGYAGNVGNIYIPYTYNDLPVTEIEDYAFCGYGDEIGKISSSSFVCCFLPDTVTRIGIGAFEGCDDLKVQLSNQSDLSVEEWTDSLIIEDRNKHVYDVILNKRPAIGWKKYYLPGA